MTAIWWIVFAAAALFAGLSLWLYTRLATVSATDKAALAQAQAEVLRLSDANLRLMQEKDDATHKAHEFEKQAILAKQTLLEIDVRMRDFEQHRAEMTKAVHATLHETGTKLASKLLEDHKREAEEKRKQQEEEVHKHSEKLVEMVKTLEHGVAQYKGELRQYGSKTELLLRAISNPSGGGQLAEQSLENFLTSLGLVKGQDFFTQWTIEGDERARLRPDVVIFLPGGRVVVIDSKTSKFLIDLAEAQSQQDEQALLVNLKNTMNKHLRDLSQKDYAGAVLKELKKHGRDAKPADITSIMYVPTETAIDRIRQADSELLRRAHDQHIVLLGPSGLFGMLSLIGHEFGTARIADNQERIVELLPDVLESFAVALGYVSDVGKAIRRAGESFNDFAKSLNGRLLPRLSKLQNLGVKPARNKAVPLKINSFSIVETTDPSLIEGEAEAMGDDDAHITRLPASHN